MIARLAAALSIAWVVAFTACAVHHPALPAPPTSTHVLTIPVLAEGHKLLTAYGTLSSDRFVTVLCPNRGGLVVCVLPPETGLAVLVIAADGYNARDYTLTVGARMRAGRRLNSS